MPLQQLVKLGPLTVTVHELTVTEVRDKLIGEEAGVHADPFRALVFDGFGLDDLAGMCDVPAEALEAFCPSDLAELVAACKAVNPFFFRMRTALAEAGLRLQVELQAKRSPAPRAPWWSAAMSVFGRMRGARSS